MQIAFSANSQEDEHSCFSDNTHRDIWLNAEGVANSYYGDYAGYDSTLDGIDNATASAVNGYGFDDYIADLGVDNLDALANEMSALLTETETNYAAIDSSARDGFPVDVLIMTKGVDNPMHAAILSLSAQAGKIAKLAQALDVTADVVDEEASACDTAEPDAACEE
jgi:putative iron-regulated protein